MKRFGTAIILSIVLALLACGGGPSSSDAVIKGNWTAALFDSGGSTALGFTATLTQSGTTVSATKFSFTTPSSCFAKGTTATGIFSVTDATHGVTSGTFQMVFQSSVSNPNGMNTLALQGTFVRNAISGTWTLSGTGLDCTGSGNFTTGDFVMRPM